MIGLSKYMLTKFPKPEPMMEEVQSQGSPFSRYDDNSPGKDLNSNASNLNKELQVV